MWPDLVSNMGPLALESDALPTALCSPANPEYLLRDGSTVCAAINNNSTDYHNISQVVRYLN